MKTLKEAFASKNGQFCEAFALKYCKKNEGYAFYLLCFSYLFACLNRLIF
jgi:hypothetical protein